MVGLTKQVLDEGWAYSLTNANGTETGEVKVGEWTPVKHFPTTVHVELIKEGRIPDPVRSLLFCESKRLTDLHLVHRTERMGGAM